MKNKKLNALGLLITLLFSSLCYAGSGQQEGCSVYISYETYQEGTSHRCKSADEEGSLGDFKVNYAIGVLANQSYSVKVLLKDEDNAVVDEVVVFDNKFFDQSQSLQDSALFSVDTQGFYYAEIKVVDGHGVDQCVRKTYLTQAY